MITAAAFSHAGVVFVLGADDHGTAFDGHSMRPERWLAFLCLLGVTPLRVEDLNPLELRGEVAGRDPGEHVHAGAIDGLRSSLCVAGADYYDIAVDRHALAEKQLFNHERLIVEGVGGEPRDVTPG